MVLVLAMIFSAMLGVMSFAEAETPEAPKELVVSAANLEFNTAVYLYIAVDYSQFGSAAGVSLKITNNKTGEVVVLNPATDITAPSNCVAFKYDTIGAKNMGDELTLQALKDGEACGKSKVYSILEYALVAQGQGNEKLSNLMVAMLAYGANAQKVMKHEGSYDLSKEYSFTKLTAGAYFEDGSTKVIMSEGSAPKTATIAGATDKTAWYNTNLDNLGVGKTISIPYAKGGQIVYAALGDPLDMRNYTGAPVVESYDGSNYVYNYADGSGSATRPTYWINSTVLNKDATRTITYNPGYLEYTAATSAGMLFTHGNFFTKDMYDQVMANGGKFTVSLTVSSNLSNKIFDHIGFRAYNSAIKGYNYKKPDGTNLTVDISDTQVISWTTPTGAEATGRLYLMSQFDAKTFSSSYNTNGTLNKSGNVVYTIPDKEFVTVDIVFDISHTVKCTNGICKGSTGTCKCYTCGQDARITVNGTEVICPKCADENGKYLGNAKVPCATCLGDKFCYKADFYVDGAKIGTETFATNDSYWQKALSLEITAGAATAGKIQSIVVSPLDIVNAK